MPFDFCVSREDEYLPALSIVTVYRHYADPSYASNHHIIDPGKYSLFYTTAGEGTVQVGSRRFVTGAGTALVANTSTTLRYGCSGDHWDFWQVEFRTDTPLLEVNRMYTLPCRAEYQELFDGLLGSMKEGEPLLAAARFQTLCALFCRHSKENPGEGDLRLFAQCMAYMEDHISDFSLKQFCADTGISPRSVNNLFQRVAKDAPYRVYQRQRAERGKVLLESTDQSVAQIAASLGYLNSSHFSRVFRGYFGKTPRSYRVDFHMHL